MKNVFLLCLLMLVFLGTQFLSSAQAGPSLGRQTHDFAALKNEVFQRTNAVRREAGLHPLRFADAMDEIADLRAAEVAKYFNHSRPDGSDWISLLEEYGIHWSACGENIALGQETAKDVMRSWLSSPGHRGNILDQRFTHIGIGVQRNRQGRLVWTQNFVRFR